MCQPRRSTLFPYTTLFRSYTDAPSPCDPGSTPGPCMLPTAWNESPYGMPAAFTRSNAASNSARGSANARWEIGRAHSELQSHVNLVCRLLLEKKNNSINLI